MVETDQPTKGRVIFRTETGSLYEVDYGEKTWTRMEKPWVEGEYPLRTGAGVFDEISEVEVGKEVQIVGPPLAPAATLRLVRTSPVVEILSTSEHAVD